MKSLLSGKKSLKWSLTTFRLDRAQGEHGWNVVSTSATHEPLFCSGLIRHSTYLSRTEGHLSQRSEKQRPAQEHKYHIPTAGEPMQALGSRRLLSLRSNTASSMPLVNTFPARLITCCILVRAWMVSSSCRRRLLSPKMVNSLSHEW